MTDLAEVVTTGVRRTAQYLEDSLTRTEEQRWALADHIEANVSVLLGGQVKWLVWRYDSGRIKFGNTVEASAFRNLADQELGNVYEIAARGGLTDEMRSHASLIYRQGLAAKMADMKAGAVAAVSFTTPSQFQPDVTLISSWFRLVPADQQEEVRQRLRVFNDPRSSPVQQTAMAHERELRGRISVLEDSLARTVRVVEWMLAAHEQAAFMRDEIATIVESSPHPSLTGLDGGP